LICFREIDVQRQARCKIFRKIPAEIEWHPKTFRAREQIKELAFYARWQVIEAQDFCINMLQKSTGSVLIESQG